MPGLALAGGIASIIGGDDRNQANAREAEKNRNWQETMSSTAHQRQMADMRKAGLNPILSASQGGAASGAGAQGVMQNSAADASRSAAELGQMKTAMKNQKADTELKTQQMEKVKAETEGAKNSAKSVKMQNDRSALANTAILESGVKDAVQDASRAGKAAYKHFKENNLFQAIGKGASRLFNKQPKLNYRNETKQQKRLRNRGQR